MRTRSPFYRMEFRQSSAESPFCRTASTGNTYETTFSPRGVSECCNRVQNRLFAAWQVLGMRTKPPFCRAASTGNAYEAAFLPHGKYRECVRSRLFAARQVPGMRTKPPFCRTASTGNAYEAAFLPHGKYRECVRSRLFAARSFGNRVQNRLFAAQQVPGMRTKPPFCRTEFRRNAAIECGIAFLPRGKYRKCVRNHLLAARSFGNQSSAESPFAAR